MRPNRSMYDEASLFESAQFSHFVRDEKLITRNQIRKLLSEDENESNKKYEELFTKYHEVETEFQRLDLTTKSKRTKAQDKKRKELLAEKGRIMDEIQQFELERSSLFEHCAETKARNQTVLWWVLFLSYREENEEPVFPGKNFEEKQKVFYEIEDEEDSHMFEVVNKFIYLVTLWNIGKIKDEKDFKNFLEELHKNESKRGK